MADKNYLVPINLNGNALNNPTLQNLGTAPGSPATGRFYFDTVALQPLFWNGIAWTNVATDSAKLNGQLPAYYLDRTHHTGSQTASTISDLASVVQAYRLDQFAAPTSPVSAGGQRITNGATPTAATDFAIKQYVDDKVAGLSWKDEVQAATTTNGTLATAFANGQTIDGYTLVTGDRILIKNQTTQSDNGIYTVNASGAPTRATDADTAAKILGATMAVMNGTANGGQRYTLTTSGSVTLGTTALTFGIFGGGTTYTFGNGLTGSSTISVLADPVTGGGIVVTSAGVKVDTAVVVRKFEQDVGDGTSTSITVTHNLGTKAVTVALYDNTTPYSEAECDVQHTSTSAITLVFANAPTTNKYHVVVHG